MRNIDKLIIHCSATRECDDSVNASVIDRWHKDRGWKGCGYHFSSFDRWNNRNR